MGFDNECIVNIQSLAGEYFCPVCRLLVYPNEALQSQCTHLYCKPCLTYVVGTTRACPYDGYLVTEPDSKPLLDSNKALAETIEKIAVRCLYHRSGCQWQGPLSDCTTHCSGCAFGNSAVVCNRCAIQILHRQVQEHAQTCSGVQPQVTQADGTQNLVAAVAAAPANGGQTQTATQSGGTNSMTPQTGAAPAIGQDPNLQASANAQVRGVAIGAGPTPEQLYQQQYYQQYPGYDPYQQAYQNYYPYPQQPQVYSQPQQVPQPIQSQTPVQAQVPPQAQGIQPQTLQNVNPQYQAHHATQPPPQMMPQAQPPSHGYPYPYPQPQSYLGGQPQQQPPQTHSQPQRIPQFQQPQPQMQQHQQQMPPQPLPQAQPQQLQQAPSHPHHQQMNQSQNPNAQPQTQQQSTQAVTGHHSYSQPQTHQHMHMGTQQRPNLIPQSGPIPQLPPHLHGQYPPQSHLPQNQVPGVPLSHQRSPNLYAQQPGYPPMQPPPPPLHPQLHPQVSSGWQPQQPQSYSSRPVISNHEAQPQAFAQSYAGYPSQAQGRPPYLGANQPFPSQNHQLRTSNQLQAKESPSQRTAEKESNSSGLETEVVDEKNQKVERDVKLGGNEDAKDTGSESQKAESISAQAAGNGSKSFETSAAEEKDNADVSQKEDNLRLRDKSKEGRSDTGVQAHTSEGSAKPEENKFGQLHGQVLGNGSGQPNPPFPPADQGRVSHLPMQYPSMHQQRPAGPPMLQPAFPPGLPHHAQVPGQLRNILRPQGSGHLPQSGQPFNPHPDHVQNLPFGRPPSQFVPHERNFELQHSGGPRMPLGKPTGSFNSSGGYMGRTPPYGAEGQIGQQRPIGLAGNESFPDPKPRYLDGQSPGTQSQGRNLKEAVVTDSSLAVGMHDERFNPLTDRAYMTLDKKHYTGLKLESGAIGAPRFLPPYYTGGVNEAGSRVPQVGVDGNIGRGNFAHVRPNFLRPVPEFGARHMDRFDPRSPVRENAGFPPRDFGDLPGFPRSRPGMGNFEGRESRPFDGGPRPFSHFQRGELEGPGFQGPRSLPGHLRLGEPTGFGTFLGPARRGDLGGPENFPHHSFISSFPSPGGDPFDNSRKRFLPNNGWCRICKVDCEGVEGLELHSQTREHQDMAMDMVRSIKLQNTKKQKMSSDRSSLEEPSKRRGAGYEVHGNKC